MRPLVPLLLLCVISGSADIKGPKAVRGHVGGSLNVTCQYDAGYERYQKWWCRGKDWGPCSILVKTSGKEKMASSDRVTIRDDPSWRRFTVTMERLMDNDTDMYWCGIEKIGPDLGFQVRVTISPAPTTVLTTTTTTTTNAPTTLVTSQETLGPPTVTHHSSAAAAGFPVPLLLPVVSAVLLLLLLTAALLAWRKLKRQRTAPEVPPEPTLDNELCYASVHFHGASVKKASTQHASSGQLSPANGAHIQLDAQEAVSYAQLSRRPRDPAPTYANTDPRGSPRAGRRLEAATEYSCIRKPRAGL